VRANNRKFARFELFNCRVARDSGRLGYYSALTLLGLLDPEDDGISILRNDGN